MKKLIIKAQRGLLYPKEKINYFGPNKESSIIRADKLEGNQLPEGSRVIQTVNGMPGTINNIPSEYKSGFRGYQRTISYGATPEQNDTTYSVLNTKGVGIIDPKTGFNNGYYKTDKVEDLILPNQSIQMPVTNHAPEYYPEKDSVAADNFKRMQEIYDNKTQEFEKTYNGVSNQMQNTFDSFPSSQFNDLEQRINQIKKNKK